MAYACVCHFFCVILQPQNRSNMESSKLPFSLSHPLEQYRLQRADGVYSKAMNYALDFFEISAQYLSIVMVGMVRASATETMPAGAVAVINKIDTKRPLSFGDWANDILPKAVAAARECLPDEPLTVAMTAVAGPKRNLWLGSKREKSLVPVEKEIKELNQIITEKLTK